MDEYGKQDATLDTPVRYQSTSRAKAIIDLRAENDDDCPNDSRTMGLLKVLGWCVRPYTHCFAPRHVLRMRSSCTTCIYFACARKYTPYSCIVYAPA